MLKKSALILLVLLAVFAAGWYLGSSGLLVAHAQKPRREYHIARSWGQLRGAMGSFLLFEEEDGTVRVVNAVQQHPVTGFLVVETLLTRK
jgi:hypothetical protein